MSASDTVATSDPGEERSSSIRPQDDLFGHVNGPWLESNEIPADLSSIGSFVSLQLDAERQTGEILRDAAARSAAGEVAPGSPLQLIGDLFASFLDEARIEHLGASPLDAELRAIEAITSSSELAYRVGACERNGSSGLFAAYVDTDDKRSDRYVVKITQGGLGLPDESYYREDSFADTRKSYVAHVAAMLTLAGRPEDQAADEASRVMALETRLARGHWDRVATRDVVKSYNLMSVDDLRRSAPSFDWAAWLDGMQAPVDVLAEAVVRQPSYLEALSDALADIPLDDWKAWLTWHVVSAAAPYLSDGFVRENFEFYFRTLTGAQELKERWKRGVALVDGLLGEALGQEYVARHFPPESKAKMDRLVENLVEAYRHDIERLDWMSPQTRARALEKLAVFRPKIGYPVRWRDYSKVTIDRADLLGNVRRATAFETDRQLAKIGGPVDRDEWLMTPQTVNAYYNPGTNEICFPAAILRTPFFDPHADEAANYGGIGAVIGHEIGHGFDDQGSQYDGEGNLVDWWTDEDRAGFTAKADKLIEQYSAFEPRVLPGHKVNGALTVGENIGDLGGLTVGLQAYELSLEGAEAPAVDGLTGTQRLMVNWARCWRSKRREELEVQLLSVDPHSPPEFRANIVRNLDEFHEAFGTQPGDGLWLEPVDRVRIW
ncbi:MAG: putative endopeptidase [Nocardioidaceae bacterium]|nr:putative endopeptidase [Nocardioidaceae bacterium]